MRITFLAAAAFSGSLGSFPHARPAQAAIRDLPGRGERKARRGKTSSIRHGAVWENPGEAAQRAGKGYGGGRRVGGFAWGVVELVSGWPLSLVALARCHSAPISGAFHSTEVPEEESLRRRPWLKRALLPQHSTRQPGTR